MSAISRWIKAQLVELNLFESEASRSNAFHLRTAVISTRFYLLLFTLAVTSLILFTSLEVQTQSVTISHPSQMIYEDLYGKYPTTLECPCNQITIPYGSFISISPEYHPVCSSLFVSDAWISLLFNQNISYFYPVDFRSSASGQFQLLASLCSLAQRSVDDAINDFLSDTILTSGVLSRSSFDEQSQAQSLFVKTSTANAVGRLFRLVRSTTYINRLQTALQTSRSYLLDLTNKDVASAFTYGPVFAESASNFCYCSFGATCFLPSTFYTPLAYAYPNAGTYRATTRPMANVTGFVAGCYAIESLLQSTLECFFDSICLYTVLTYFPLPNNSTFRALNSNQTRFDPQTRIETLANELFIENWSTVTSFSSYYEQCAPISCTYMFTQRNNVLYILTKLLGLYGGLTVALRLIVPRLISWWRNRTTQRAIPAHPNAHLSVAERLRAAWSWMLVQMIELNVFKSVATRNNPYELVTSRIATRIYLLLLSVSISILVIYTASNVQTQTVTVQNPSQTIYEDLREKYSTTIQCPCKQIVIPYGSFVSLSPQYHPVCSSLFVSDEWIISTGGRYPTDVNHIENFEGSGQYFFNALATLCSLAQDTVSDAWQIFNKSAFVTVQTLSDLEFMVRTRSALNQFESHTVVEFKRIFAIIQSHTRNMFLDQNNANFATSHVTNNSIRIEFPLLPKTWGNCSCALKDGCLQPIGLYSPADYYGDYYNVQQPIFNIPNFFVGCSIIQGVLQSSLECFFDQECLDAIQWQIISPNSLEVPILEANTTQYSPQTLIGVLLDELMIEQWGVDIQYNRYYAQCAPKLCSYTFISHNNALYVFTTLLGLFGGLTVALKVLVPIIIGFIRSKMRPKAPEMINLQPVLSDRRLTLTDRVRPIWDWFKTKVLKLNVFESEATWHDDYRIRTEIIATRIYILVLTISIGILITYTYLTIQTQYIIVQNPSRMTFEQLQANPQYSATLKCPCQNISIPYSSFFSISPHFHQLCSSDFISKSSAWLNLLYYREATLNYSYFDYRLFAIPQFQWLVSLCTLANETLSNALNLFASKTLVTGYLQSLETIETQATAAIVQFRLSTPRTFVRMLDFIRYMAQGNGIVSSITSNWQFFALIRNLTQYFEDDFIPLDSFWSEPRSYGDGDNCSCGTNAMCTSSATIDGSFLPGFLVGCYPLEALLQSTLECLYNMTCINTLKNMYHSSNLFIHTLDPILSSPNLTVQSLVNALMIDRWESNITYDQYYLSCAPFQCTYSFNQRVNLVYVVTTIIGLFGGLSVVFKLIAPTSVKILRYIRMHHHRRQMVMPTAATEA